MWTMKELYINTLNALSEEEQTQLWWDLDKYRNTTISIQEVYEVFEAYSM